MLRLSGKNTKVPLQNVHIPVTVGNIVTFACARDSARRKPVSILYVRHDVDWFYNNTNHISFEKSMYFSFIFDFDKYKKDFTQHKLFFENYAKDNGFDPFVPENWYFQTAKNILAIKVLNTTHTTHNNTQYTTIYNTHNTHYTTHTTHTTQRHNTCITQHTMPQHMHHTTHTHTQHTHNTMHTHTHHNAHSHTYTQMHITLQIILIIDILIHCIC
jgi:hypothetical protein